MKDLLQVFMRRLTNLNSHNRSLLLLRLITGQHIDLNDFDFLIKDPSFTIIEKLIAGKGTVPLCNYADPRDEDSNIASEKLRKILRTDRFILEERGARDLYVGWPFVRGKFNNDSMVRCPLLFFPVQLLRNGNNWILVPRDEVPVTFNKSFLLAYFYFNEVGPDDNLIEHNFEDFDNKSRPFRTQLYNLLKDSRIEINFNVDMFEDKLETFREFKKKEYGKNEKPGMLKLFSEAVLGIFPQAGSYLLPDYREILEKNEYQSVEEFFLKRTITTEELNPISAGYFLNRIKEEQIFTPLEMDAWQENALKAVKQGHSVVIQGPPGTGKSQLLCNLIADFISRGKSVLAVSQKRAALDVVYERLGESGISEFCALVHDFRNDRKAIYTSISDHIDKLDEYRTLNNSIDAIQLERNFLKLSRKIDKISEELEDLKHSIFDESECGISLKELYLTSNREHPFVDLRQEYRNFRFNNLDDFTEKLKRHVSLSNRIKHLDNFWKQRVSFSTFGMNDLSSLSRILQEVPDFLVRVREETHGLFGSSLSFEDLEYFLENAANIKEIADLTGDGEVYRICRNRLQALRGESIADPVTIVSKMLDCFNDVGPETSLPSEELGKLQEALQHLIDSRKNPFRWLGWILFSREKYFIRRVLVSNHMGFGKEDLKVLTKRLDNRLHIEHYLTELKELKWIRNIPDVLDYRIFKVWAGNLEKGLRAFNEIGQIRNLGVFLGLKELDHAEFRGKLHDLIRLLGESENKLTGWNHYLSNMQIRELASGNAEPEKSAEELKHNFECLCEFDRLAEGLLNYEAEVIKKILEQVDERSSEAVTDLFDNSIRLAWIEHIEMKFPVINIIHTGRFDELVKELQSAVKEKRKIASEIILLKLREITYEGMRFNRLNNRETYRDLQHQVSKKRSIWPIRKLFTGFYEEILRLQPCWLASPESASAIFPAIPFFDLVIFDEASQCFSEKGLPAMYKGKQVVIAGDSNQLSPYDLYQTRWDMDEEENPDTEIDSLLDFASRYLLQMQLNGHYRSRTPDLIEFSNRHFYRNGLKLLPDRIRINRREPGIKYIKVDGNWENNRNVAEAERVVQLISEIRIKDPAKSIGVITFNAPQQDLIAEKTENITDRSVFNPKSFIKNIENVQGDESDIIIFSLVHAPDKNGRMTRQFGNLNIIKGENRLNVAITRAREFIYVVASFWPWEMDIKGLKNKGPEFLKKYLEFAYEVSEGKFRAARKEDLSKNRPWYLRDRLRNDLALSLKADIILTDEMPFADITIRHNDSYIGLLLTDDEHYFGSLSVKDVHVYTPFTLSAKNWKFLPVFSRDYWKNKDEVIENITRFIYQSFAV